MKIQAYKNNTQNSRQNFGKVSFIDITSSHPRILIIDELPDVVHIDTCKTFVLNEARQLSKYIVPIAEAVKATKGFKMKDPKAEVVSAPCLERFKCILLNIIDQIEDRRTLRPQVADKLRQVVCAANEGSIIPMGMSKVSGLSLGS